MIKQIYFKYIFSFTVLFLVGCNNYPETPEGVIEKYLEFLSTGDCEKALGFCYGDAKEILLAHIESGCEPQITTIDSINCQIQDTICECSSYENHSVYGNIKIPYNLVLIKGKWKLVAYSKDANLDINETQSSVIKSDEVNTMIFFNDTQDTVTIFYHGQCAYDYPIQNKNDSVYVYFDTLEDCIYRSGVKEFYNLPQGEYPKIGDLFLVMKIDSIRSYNRFLFPRWVDSVNSIHGKQNILTSEFIVPKY